MKVAVVLRSCLDGCTPSCSPELLREEATVAEIYEVAKFSVNYSEISVVSKHTNSESRACRGSKPARDQPEAAQKLVR